MEIANNIGDGSSYQVHRRSRTLTENCYLLIFEVLTVYKFFYSAPDVRLKNPSISLKRLVSAEGIEPSTY